MKLTGKNLRSTFLLLVTMSFISNPARFSVRAAEPTRAEILKGALTPERTCYDVTSYHLDVRIDPATKSKLEAAVGTLEPFMRLQETGGQGHARDASRKAVPKGAKRGKSGIIPKGQRPRALLSKPKHFLVKTRFGSAVMKRQGKKRYPIEAMFWLKRTVPIKPRFGFKGQVEGTTDRRFALNWVTSMDAAAPK